MVWGLSLVVCLFVCSEGMGYSVDGLIMEFGVVWVVGFFDCNSFVDWILWLGFWWV